MEKPQHAARMEQVVTAADIDSLLVAGEFERAKEWSRARIVYLEKVIQELPTASSQLETTDIASWQATRSALLEELRLWRDKAEYIETFIAKK